MKAVMCRTYGPPEIAKVENVEKPVPKNKEVLIKISYSTVNRTDAGMRSAEYFISRFWSGLLKPRNPIFGCEFSGVIEEIGQEVKLFKRGDRVFGYNDANFGGHAEYNLVNEDSSIAILPEEIPFDIGACLTEGSHYALNYIRAVNLKPNDNVLVYGATGAIGSAAVQILKNFNVNIIAVCNTKNIDLVKSLGANKVIDYEKEDFTKIKERFDFILDAVGKSSFFECKKLLKDNGTYASTELGKYVENPFLALYSKLIKGKKVIFPIPTINKDDLIYILSLVKNKSYKPVIDRTYKIDDIVDAYKYVESGQKVGNVILKVGSSI